MTKDAKPSALGRSLRLSDGELVIDSGDFVTVVGRDNFLQAMQVMIETPFGTDVFNVNYGFDILGILSSAHSVRLTKELIRLNIVKSVSQDNRVREIKAVLFDDEQGFFDIAREQNAEEQRRIRKTERRWQAVVVLQTISEGEVALRLEGTGLRT